MTLRESLTVVVGETPITVIGVDEEAEQLVRLGGTPQWGAYMLWRGASAYALIGDDLDDYIDEPIVKMTLLAEPLTMAIYVRLKRE